jgi:hypothetical protein
VRAHYCLPSLTSSVISPPAVPPLLILLPHGCWCQHCPVVGHCSLAPVIGRSLLSPIYSARTPCGICGVRAESVRSPHRLHMNWGIIEPLFYLWYKHTESIQTPCGLHTFSLRHLDSTRTSPSIISYARTGTDICPSNSRMDWLGVIRSHLT